MAPLVDGLAAKDAFLFLWAPNSIVLDGTADLVIKKWGFVAKQLIPWVKTDKSGKPRLGIGHYTRVCTEQLILARRGKPKVKRHNIPGVIIAPRGKHSAKPDESYQLIESLVDGEYLELYARRRYSSRWTCWGNQLEAAA
jgi:N6-adenosine-specific RNA methylase IME4